MNDLQPSGSARSHNHYALSSFAPSHRRLESNQSFFAESSIASYTPPPPVLILNSLSPVWETKPPVPKKSRRQSMGGWELSNGSLPSSPTQDDSLLGSLKRAVSPFRQPDSLETRPSVYHTPPISTPTSLRSRSNSSSSSVPPITPNEVVPIPPPKPYHYTRRSQTFPIVPEKTTVSYPRPPDIKKDMAAFMATKRQSALIQVKDNRDTTPSRATSHSDPDLTQTQRQRQQQRDDASSGAEANAHPIIRDLEPQTHISPKDHTPVKERTQGGAEISTQSPPVIVPSRRKESLPQAIFTSSKDDLNLPQPTLSSSQKSDSIVAKPWGRRKDSIRNKRESRRASSIFLPHLIPNPNLGAPPEDRITEEEEEEPPGTPGIRRRDERNGWSGEWNQDTIQEVIDKLRALR